MRNFPSPLETAHTIFCQSYCTRAHQKLRASHALSQTLRFRTVLFDENNIRQQRRRAVSSSFSRVEWFDDWQYSVAHASISAAHFRVQLQNANMLQISSFRGTSDLLLCYGVLVHHLAVTGKAGVCLLSTFQVQHNKPHNDNKTGPIWHPRWTNQLSRAGQGNISTYSSLFTNGP